MFKLAREIKTSYCPKTHDLEKSRFVSSEVNALKMPA